MMMGHDTLATDEHEFTPAEPGQAARLFNWVRARLARKPAPIIIEEEPGIYLEDTIRGETVRFTGKDDRAV